MQQTVRETVFELSVSRVCSILRFGVEIYNIGATESRQPGGLRCQGTYLIRPSGQHSGAGSPPGDAFSVIAQEQHSLCTQTVVPSCYVVGATFESLHLMGAK